MEGRMARSLASSLVSSCSNRASVDKCGGSRESVMAEGRGGEELRMGAGLAEDPALDKPAVCRLVGGEVGLSGDS